MARSSPIVAPITDGHSLPVRGENTNPLSLPDSTVIWCLIRDSVSHMHRWVKYKFDLCLIIINLLPYPSLWDVQVIQSCSKDGKTFKYAEMLIYLNAKILNC